LAVRLRQAALFGVALGVTALLAPPAPAWAVEGATHLSVSTTDARGRVGDTVSIRVTVRNHGPVVEPEWALTGVETQPGTRFVSGTGCRRDPDGGKYCASPGPLAVGKSQTVILRYKIVHTVPHPDWEMAGFGFYEALFRTTNTDDVDVNFQIYILGPAAATTRPAAVRTSPTRVRAGQTPARASRTSAAPRSPTPPSSEAPVPLADPVASPTVAAFDSAERVGFSTGWAAALLGVAVLAVAAAGMVAYRRRTRPKPELSPGEPELSPGEPELSPGE
jgi:hypothetical protein